MTAPDILPPPHSIEIEQYVLGAILMNNEAAEIVQHALAGPEDFFEPIHRQIYEAAIQLIADGRIASPASLRSCFPQEYKIADFTISEYLARVAAEAQPLLLTRHYALDLRNLAARRAMIETAEAVIEVARGGAPDLRPEHLAAKVVDAMDAIIVRSLPMPPSVSIGKAARMALDTAEKVRAGQRSVGLPTGIRALDKLVIGLEPGELIILAGRPGMGKTAFLVSLALNFAQRGDPVLAFSLEMTGAPLGQRAMSALCFDSQSAVEYREIRRATGLSDQNMASLYAAAGRLDGIPFQIEQQGGLSIAQIASRARRWQAKLAQDEKRLGLLAIDHIGLVSPNVRQSNREREVAEISKALKTLAKELNVPILALSQLSRQVETRQDKRPQLSDLRESGSIEQDADIVIGLFREAYYLEGRPDLSDQERMRLYETLRQVEAIVLKNRQGGTGTATLTCHIGSNFIGDLRLEMDADRVLEEPVF